MSSPPPSSSPLPEQRNSRRRPPTGDAWVTLNVGGQRYETYLSTLRKLPGTMLERMFAADSPIGLQQNARGEYLIDRNGRVFEVVLDFLRTGRLCVPPSMSPAQVAAEIDFYQLPCQSPVSPKLRLVDQLVYAHSKDKAESLFTQTRQLVFQHLQAAADQGHEEVGVNLIPQYAAEHDSRYSGLKGAAVGSVWAPNINVLNVLVSSGHLSKSFLHLLSQLYSAEGFKVEVGERANYFNLGRMSALASPPGSPPVLHVGSTPAWPAPTSGPFAHAATTQPPVRAGASPGGTTSPVSPPYAAAPSDGSTKAPTATSSEASVPGGASSPSAAAGATVPASSSPPPVLVSHTAVSSSPTHPEFVHTPSSATTPALRSSVPGPASPRASVYSDEDATTWDRDLYFMVLSWRHTYTTTGERLSQTLSRINHHVEQVALYMRAQSKG